MTCKLRHPTSLRHGVRVRCLCPDLSAASLTAHLLPGHAQALSLPCPHLYSETALSLEQIRSFFLSLALSSLSVSGVRAQCLSLALIPPLSLSNPLSPTHTKRGSRTLHSCCFFWCVWERVGKGAGCSLVQCRSTLI